MINCPVIVIGPPRSGTTMVAGVLQDFFGVLMDGSPLPPPQHLHKLRWLEDSRLVEMNTLFELKMIKLNAWTRRFKRFIRGMEKQAKGGLWGFKDPRLVPVLGYALSFFKSPTIVRCHRDRDMVINSYTTKLKWEKDEAEKYYDTREVMLDIQLKNRVHYRINFGEYVTEEEIMEFFQSGEMLRHAA